MYRIKFYCFLVLQMITLSGNIDGFTFPLLSTCRKPRDAASKLENTSSIVERAKGPIANPESFPHRATRPQEPDSSTDRIFAYTTFVTVPDRVTCLLDWRGEYFWQHRYLLLIN
jgi:hypothetical protein